VESEAVNIDGHITATTSGWAATATHDALDATLGCAIYYGNASAPGGPGEPTAPGEISCKTI